MHLWFCSGLCYFKTLLGKDLSLRHPVGDCVVLKLQWGMFRLGNGSRRGSGRIIGSACGIC